MEQMKRSWLVGLTLVSLLGLAGMVWNHPVRAQEQNLLVNGDFEWGCGEAWPFQDGIPEVQVAPGWRGFWLDNPPPPYANMPNYCVGNPECVYWGRPEFRGIMPWQDPMRVHGGNCAQKLHSFARQMEAGLLQRVEGILPGATLRFQAHVQTWSCMGTPEQWNVCPTAPYSNNPAPTHVRVGIDPTGGTDPWAGSVVWSAEIHAWDNWRLISVDAVAQSSAVTVFVYNRPDWVDGIARPNNDFYIDDAALYYVSGSPPTSPQPPPATRAPVTPRPPITATPRPDGAVVHTVQRGDTLYSIAMQYGVSVEQITQLNAGSIGPNGLIEVGQELVISVATPTLPPTAPPTPPPPPSPTVAANGSLCVLAFHDRNGDSFRQPETEELLPNTTVTLTLAGAVVGQYVTDGLSEPHCFDELLAGSYRLAMQPPDGYVASGPAQSEVTVSAGAAVDVALGVQRGAPATATSIPEATSSASRPGGGALFIGAALLVLAIVVAILFVIRRRR